MNFVYFQLQTRPKFITINQELNLPTDFRKYLFQSLPLIRDQTQPDETNRIYYDVSVIFLECRGWRRIARNWACPSTDYCSRGPDARFVRWLVKIRSGRKLNPQGSPQNNELPRSTYAISMSTLRHFREELVLFLWGRMPIEPDNYMSPCIVNISERVASALHCLGVRTMVRNAILALCPRFHIQLQPLHG